jgi:hypothetical protein
MAKAKSDAAKALADDPNASVPVESGSFDKSKVSPDVDARSDDGLSSQPQHSTYKSQEPEEANPPNGPETVQERGVAKP